MEELPYFVDVDFRMGSPGHSKSLSPHVTSQVRLPKNGDVMFPWLISPLEGSAGKHLPIAWALTCQILMMVMAT